MPGVSVVISTGFHFNLGKFLANQVQQKALYRRCNACHRDENSSYMIIESLENQYQDENNPFLLLSCLPVMNKSRKGSKRLLRIYRYNLSQTILQTFDIKCQRLKF